MTKNKINIVVKAQSSAQGSLDATDYKKIAKSIGIAFGGAFLYAVLTWLMVYFGGADFQWGVFWKAFSTACVPAALAVGINAAIKVFQGESK